MNYHWAQPQDILEAPHAERNFVSEGLFAWFNAKGDARNPFAGLDESVTLHEDIFSFHGLNRDGRQYGNARKVFVVVDKNHPQGRLHPANFADPMVNELEAELACDKEHGDSTRQLLCERNGTSHQERVSKGAGLERQ